MSDLNSAESRLWGQYAQLLQSKLFFGEDRICDVLKYLLELYISGETPTTKGIAVNALKRRESTFEGRSDPSVRMAMKKLRDALHEYNEDEGRKSAPLLFFLEKNDLRLHVIANAEVMLYVPYGDPSPVEKFSFETCEEWIYRKGPIPGVEDASYLFPPHVTKLAKHLSRRILEGTIQEGGVLLLPWEINTFFDALNDRSVLVGTLDGQTGVIYPSVTWIPANTVLEQISRRGFEFFGPLFFLRAEVDRAGLVPYASVERVEFSPKEENRVWVHLDSRGGCIHYWKNPPGVGQLVEPNVMIF